ncbi:MAG: beta-lactamase family protein [Bradymonadaceae bacterium]|nr:beta-lactamase family protein [Lujinxingiaceae bacterium]
MKYMLSILCACFLLATTAPAFAQNTQLQINPVQMGKFVTEVKSAMKMPSVAVGIVGKEKSLYFETYGATNSDEPFVIAALSQSVTATAVLLLASEGKLAVDDAAVKWIPGVPEAVTIADLLGHRSGLTPSDTPREGTANDATIVERVQRASWAGARGEFVESALNYQILGELVALVSEQSYGDFVHEHIFAAAGLSSAHAGAEPPSARAGGHQYIFGFARAQGDDAGYGSAAVASDFIWMSARDMERWLRLFITAGKLDNKRVLPEQVITGVLETAGAWTMSDEEGLAIARRTGFTRGYSASMALVPEREIGVFVLTNVGSWEGYAPERIGAGMLGAVLQRGNRALTNVEFVVRVALGTFLLLLIFTIMFELYRWFAAKMPRQLDSRARSRVAITTALAIATPAILLVYLGISPMFILTMAPDVGFGILAMMLLVPLHATLKGFSQTVLRRLEAMLEKFM